MADGPISTKKAIRFLQFESLKVILHVYLLYQICTFVFY